MRSDIIRPTEHILLQYLNYYKWTYRLELSNLQSSPPSTPSESLLSVGSGSSSSELTKARAVIPDSILQLPVQSDSNLASKRGSFDSGYVSPRKINTSIKSKKHVDLDQTKEEDKKEGITATEGSNFYHYHQHQFLIMYKKKSIFDIRISFYHFLSSFNIRRRKWRGHKCF